MTRLQDVATYHARLSSIESLSATVLHCQLTTEVPLSYAAGQYCMVAVGATARAYSFVTPSGSTHLEWLIDTKPNGQASQFFRAARTNDALTFTAPYGDFVLDPADTRPLLYIAGGTGIAPIMAHILTLLPDAPPRPITLVVGHRARADMFWHQKLELLAAAHAFSYRGVVGPFLDILPTLPNLLGHTVYICGSAGMCTATAEVLYKNGVPPSQVHYELFT